MNKLQKQINLAKKHIRKEKKNNPYIFPEWQLLQKCEYRLQRAKEEYKVAKEIWNKLGN
jgi:sugar-specific transcriptional regulator TrmB